MTSNHGSCCCWTTADNSRNRPRAARCRTVRHSGVSSIQYAVKVGDLQWVQIPSGQSVARPEALRAMEEATNSTGKNYRPGPAIIGRPKKFNSRPVAPPIARDEPYGENVEGISYLWDKRQNRRATLFANDAITRRNAGLVKGQHAAVLLRFRMATPAR
jgi:hypothetical protein